MPGPIARLYATLGLDAREFGTGVKGAQGMLGGLGDATTVAAGAAGFAIGGFVADGVGAFAQLDTKMREVFTLLPGISEQAKNELTQDARDFAKEFGVSTDEAIGGLYNSLSAGVPQDNVFEFMATAQKAATGGVADLTSSVGLLSAVTKGYGDVSVEATNKASDLAFTTVKLGQTTFPELAASIGKVVPQAQALNISQEELFGTMATLTGVTGNTAEVSTQLKAIQTSLIKPSADLARVFKEQGIESGKAAIETYGFQGTLELLKSAAGGSDTELAKMLGSSEALTAALALTGAQSGKFTANVEAMGGAAGATDAAFAEMDSGIEASGRKIGAFFNDLKLTVGKELQAFGPLFIAFGPQMSRWIGRGLGAVAGVIGEKLAAPAVRIAVGAAGSAAGLIYQGAVFVASKFTAAAIALWGLMGGPRVLAAASTAGAAAGSAYAGASAAGGFLGAATKALAGAALVAAPAVVAHLTVDAIAPRKTYSDPKIQQFARNTGLDVAGGVTKSVQDGIGSVADFFGLRNDENRRAKELEDSMRAIIVTGTSGAMNKAQPAVAAAVATATQPLATMTDWLGGIIVEPIEDEFDNGVKAVKLGFGNIKQALKDPPQLISRSERVDNLERRFKRSMQQLRKAVEADDPVNIRYWTAATAKAKRRLDNMGRSGKTTTEDIKDAFRNAGIGVDRSWLGMERSARRSSRRSRREAIAEFRALVGDVKGLDLQNAGTKLIQSWLAGIKLMRDTVTGVASSVANAFANMFKSNSPPKMGPLSTIDKDGASLIDVWLGGIGSRRGRVKRMSRELSGDLSPTMRGAAQGGAGATQGGDGGGTHIHVHGNVYGGKAGLRHLAAEIEGAVRPTRRDRRFHSLAEG